MRIAGQEFTVSDTLDTAVYVPDCIVRPGNKIGTGNGEAKLYIASKEIMYGFFGTPGFTARCFVLRQDLVDYMNAIHVEYLNPSQPYRRAADMASLWTKRMSEIGALPEVVEFSIHDQQQIQGPRGYVKSGDKGYGIIREISLPLVSYIFVMRLADTSGQPVFYWKLFADFEAISNKQEALVYTYGKKNRPSEPAERKENPQRRELYKARHGQGLYRERLLAECPFCPITMINDERLLVASHIKPWAVSTEQEKTDPKNGFMLSPLYDRLFDRGLMTFSEDRRILLSNWISPANKNRLGVKEGQLVQLLPLDDERKKYMDFHRTSVYKG